jgi:hypothetical protein
MSKYVNGYARAVGVLEVVVVVLVATLVVVVAYRLLAVAGIL